MTIEDKGMGLGMWEGLQLLTGPVSPRVLFRLAAVALVPGLDTSCQTIDICAYNSWKKNSLNEIARIGKPFAYLN